MTIRTAALAVLLLFQAAATAAAQDSVVPLPGAGDTVHAGYRSPWLLSYFPYVGGGAGGGPVAIGRVRYFQPAIWQDRVTYRADLVGEIGIGLHGSHLARMSASAPLLAPGWRATADVETIRNTRANFYGLGNETERSDARLDADEFAYQTHHTSYAGSAEVSRQLHGPFWIAAGGGVSHDRFYALSPGSAFALAFGDRATDTDVSGKLELVLDTRDNEFDPLRGVVAEAGIQQGSGGDGYTRLFGMVRGYHAVSDYTVLAARVAASDIHGTPPLAALLALPTWESPVRVYGGSRTNRGLDGGRFTGTGVLMGSAEVRQYVTTIKHAVTIGVVGFVDAGRVFQGERLRLTTDDLAVSGGGGLVLMLLRGNTAVFNVAQGPDGVEVSVSGGWAF
ncbi:MAG TPA: BamA/TamA family outer membrane protein [Gemmatimonadales bacterium]|nr:BamA/TamA family outer membrane protein [Gemmatimonadales bacterium]